MSLEDLGDQVVIYLNNTFPGLGAEIDYDPEFDISDGNMKEFKTKVIPLAIDSSTLMNRNNDFDDRLRVRIALGQKVTKTVNDATIIKKVTEIHQSFKTKGAQVLTNTYLRKNITMNKLYDYRELANSNLIVSIVDVIYTEFTG